MDCGNCRHINEAGAKFCSECGAPFAPHCPACDAEQLAGAKFCNQCGSTMGATSAETQSPASPEPSAVRKQVTALFADLVGSTAFGEQVDPEAARAALAPYFDMLRATVEDHAGSVIKFTGDGVMAIFGVPEVAEDDALRAVDAGAELQRRFLNFADQVRERHGIELGLRVGVNSGELVLGDDDADLVGDVLNTAARLEAACVPGRVMVGEDTWRLTRSNITYEVLGEVRVKGKSDPIATFQVVDDAHSTGEELVPFVGRAAELNQLHDAFAEARDSPIIRLVTVIGPPGVGKTRLAHELRVATDARSFDLRFERRGSTTFSPIAELLREVTDGTAEGVARLMTDSSESERLTPILQSFLGLSDARSTEESFWAVRRLIEHMSVAGPIILVVDDIQWAEPLFWDLLEHLVEWAEAPVLIVALARPELRELRPELAQVGRQVSASISLEGLDEASTRELAARILDTDELPTDLIERIPDTTEGNPLFVRELIQMLVDDGTLARDGDRWRLTIDVDAIEVPPTILSLLASRVERLPDAERQVIELASVIGTEFDRGTLEAISAGGLAGGLGALIDRLRRKELIEPSGAWAGDHPVYRFHHVLVRDAAYRRLLKGRRAELHALVGHHLEDGGQGEQGGDDLDVTVAYHFEQVFRFRSELGTVDEATREMAAAAVNRLRVAGEHALDREDLPSAGGYAQRALDLVGSDDPARDELLVLGCEALLSSGNVAAATPLVDELHDRSTDKRLSAWADCFRAQLWSFTDPDKLSEAVDMASEATNQLAALGDNAGVAKARLVRASCLARLGRVGDCEDELDLALGAARAAGDQRSNVALLGATPLAAVWGPSPAAQAGGRCLDVLRLLRITTASPAVEATSIRCQGLLDSLLGRLDSAREKFEISRTTARELGLRQGLYETELFAGFAEMWVGDADAAEPHLRLAYEGLGRQGIAADAGHAGAMLAQALLQQGHLDDAERLATEALESAGENLQTAITSRAALAEIRAAQGRHDEARDLAERGIEIAQRTDAILDHGLVLLAASRVAEAAGRTADAQLAEQQANDLFERKGAARDVGISPVSESPLPASPATREDSRLSNTATEVYFVSYNYVLAGDREAMATLFAHDSVTTFHADIRYSAWAHATLNSEETIDMLFVQIPDAEVFLPEVLAIRSDNLCLIRSPMMIDGVDRTFLQVLRTRGHEVLRFDWFHPDQLNEALDLLNQSDDPDAGPPQQGLAPAPDPQSDPVSDNPLPTSPAPREDSSLSNTAAEIYFVLYKQLLVGDREAMAIGYADDFLARNHVDLRHSAWAHATLGSEQLLDLLFVTMPDTEYFPPEVIAIRGDNLCLVRMPQLIDGVDRTFLQVLRTRGDKVLRFDWFHPGQINEALDLLNQYHQPDAGSPQQTPAQGDTLDELGLAAEQTSQVLTNHATSVVLAMQTAWDSRDRAMFGALFADDIQLAMNNAGILASREGLISSVDDDVLNPAAATSELVIIAIRGDDLCVYEMNQRSQEFTVSYYWVLQSRDNQIAKMIWFDHFQLIGALDELDRAWAESGGPADGIVLSQRIRHQFASGTVEEFAELFSRDVIVIDHRQLGMGTRNYDEWITTAEPTIGNTDIVTQAVWGTYNPVGLARTHVTHRPDGSVWEMYVLATIEPGTGLIDRWENFDVTEHAAAHARYDELVQEAEVAHDDQPGFTNRAWTTAQKFRNAWASRDREACLSLLEGEFTAQGQQHGHTGIEFTAEQLVDLVLDTEVYGDGSTREFQLIALRGDDLCLCRIDERVNGTEAQSLSLLQTAPGADGARLLLYDIDQLQEAQTELDRLYLNSIGYDDDHYFHRLIETVAYNVDPEAMAAAIHPDLEYVEHRPLTFESGGPSQVAENMSSNFTKMTVTIPKIHRWTDHGLILERCETAVDEIAEFRYIAVMTFDAELIRRMELFPPDQLVEAFARYDELVP